MTFFYDEIGVMIVFTSLKHQHNIGRFKVGLRYNSCSRGRNMGAKPVARAQRPLDYRSKYWLGDEASTQYTPPTRLNRRVELRRVGVGGVYLIHN